MGRLSETAIAFAGAGRASTETAIAFAGAKWVFLVQFSGTEAMPVSTVPCWGRAVVLLVSMSPRCRALCAKKFAQRAHNGPKMAFSGVLGEFFRGNAAEWAVLGEFFRGNAAGGAVLGEFFRGRAAGGAVLGEFFRGPAVVGSHRANIVAPQPWPPALLLAVLTLRYAAIPT